MHAKYWVNFPFLDFSLNINVRLVLDFILFKDLMLVNNGY